MKLLAYFCIVLLGGCVGTQQIPQTNLVPLENLITHGKISDGFYEASAEGRFYLTPPMGWDITLEPPLPDFEDKIKKKIIRPRELGYLVKNDRSAFILVEKYWLTWGGKPIFPLDITWDKRGTGRFTKACEQGFTREKKNSEKVFTSFKHECFDLQPKLNCTVSSACRESYSEKIADYPSGYQISIEDKYIYGDMALIVHNMNKKMGIESYLSDDAHGWRVAFTLISPLSANKENKTAFDKLVKSMRSAKVENRIPHKTSPNTKGWQY